MENIKYDANKEYYYVLAAAGWTPGSGWDYDSVVERVETDIKSQVDLDEYLKAFADDANPIDLMGDYLNDPENLEDGKHHDVWWENRLIASDGYDEEIIASSGVWESEVRKESGIDDEDKEDKYAE